MGLAERFKKHIENKDLFKETEKSLNSKSSGIKFISKPVENQSNEVSTNSEIQNEEKRSSLSDFEVKTPSINSQVNSNIEGIQNITNISSSNCIRVLTTEILRKISKTPYWNEFSTSRKESMIEKYFIKRTPKNEQHNITENLIREVLNKSIR